MPNRQPSSGHAPAKRRSLSSARNNGTGDPIHNGILLSIPEPEYKVLRTHLEYVDLPRHTSLHEPNHTIEYAYFLNRGLVSLIVETQDGRTVEVGLVGNDGVAGIPSSVGLRKSPLREVIQIPGDGFRMGVRPLQRALESAPVLRALLNRYAVLQGLQISQTAACNRLHEVGPRLARWLLMVQDQMEAGPLAITHDFLATMLGTDRPSVTLAAGALQKKGAIEYTRGTVKIRNRAKLEGASCECYEVMRGLTRS